jgi:MFS family permease
MYGAFTLVPQLVQTPTSSGYGFGASVTVSGLFLLPMAITMLFAGPAAGRLGALVGFKATLVAACVLGVVGFVTFTVAHSRGWGIAAGAAILGVGIGFAFSSLANVLVAAVEPHETAEATGVNTIVRTVGGALGAQAAAAIVTARTSTEGLPAESGYTIAFAVSAGAMAVAVLLSLTLPRRTPTPPAGNAPMTAGRAKR